MVSLIRRMTPPFRCVFRQEAFKPRTPLLAPFYPFGVVDYTLDQLTGLLRWRKETTGEVHGDLDASIRRRGSMGSACQGQEQAFR